MEFIVRMIVSAIIRAIVNSIIYSIAIAINKAVAGAVTNSIEKSLQSKLLANLSGMSDFEKEEFVKDRIIVQVHRVGFGKYQLHFQEYIYGVYSYTNVSHKDSILVDLGKNMQAVNELNIKNIAKGKVKISKTEFAEVEQMINMFNTIAWNLMYPQYLSYGGDESNVPSLEHINLKQVISDYKLFELSNKGN